MEEKAKECIFGSFDRHLSMSWRCLRFGDDQPTKCERCEHFITDDLFENIRRIKS
jgi:hypothetical protein